MKTILLALSFFVLAGCDSIPECKAKAKKMGVDPYVCLEHKGRFSVRKAFTDFVEHKIKEAERGSGKVRYQDTTQQDTEVCQKKVTKLENAISDLTDTIINCNRERDDLADQLYEYLSGKNNERPGKQQEGSWRE